jgi:hypothetical protein
MEVVYDRLVTGRRFQCLTMTDPGSKEVSVIDVDLSIGGARVCRILDRLFATRPLPDTLILDNGPEFAGTALDAWAAQHGVHLHCIQPGKTGSDCVCRTRQRQISGCVFNGVHSPPSQPAPGSTRVNFVNRGVINEGRSRHG